MINHSPETVTMEGLEDNRFYQLIFADDISTLEDVSTTEGLSTEGSFVVESTLHGIHTGTFDISATVTSPILFDILGTGGELVCSEEKRFRLLCVRFIVLDEPGAKDRKKDPRGLLKGVKYNGKNIGEVSDATVATARAALEKANAFWLQCFAHCCWIRFDLHTEDGKPAVYALDPKGKPVVYENGARIVDGPKRGKVKVTETIDLTQFLDKQNSRGISMKDGGKKGTIAKEVTWDQDVGSDIKKGDSAQEAIEEAARSADKQRRKRYYERMAEKSRTAPLNVLETFGDAIDQELGEKCINIIIVKPLNDSGGTGDESGFATIGGRNIFLEDSELDSDSTSAVLAHELGHNLGLEHVKIDGRLMNEGNAGNTLIKKECDDACNGAAGKALKPAALSEAKAKERFEAEKEARRKAEEEAEKAEEESKAREEEEERKAEEEASRQKEIDEIDKRIGEIDGRTAELEKEIKAKEDKFRESIEKMKGMSKAEKQRILDDNLPIQARKEKAELEKLNKEKAELEVKKAGLQR